MSNAKTICTVCNYIYDEGLGEPRQEIAPFLKFEDLADDWGCPECGSAKDMFQPCSCVSLPIYELTCIAHQPVDSFRKNAEGTFSKTTSVGQLVAEHPTSACVLEQLGIDYCCGGKATLEEACAKKGVDVEEVLQRLLVANQKQSQFSEPDWTTASLKELIDHIITTHHRPLQQELVRLALLAEKVARVHKDKHPKMAEVQTIFNRFKAQLELHMQKEEMVLFPGIASMEATGSPQIFGCGGGIEHPIEVMDDEHEDAAEALRALRWRTNDYTPPADACNSFKALLYSLAQLESDMYQHVHKENNILFPRALELRQLELVAEQDKTMTLAR